MINLNETNFYGNFYATKDFLSLGYIFGKKCGKHNFIALKFFKPEFLHDLVPAKVDFLIEYRIHPKRLG